MRNISLFILLIALVSLHASPSLAQAADAKATATFKPALWAFRNGVSFGSFENEAKVLKELGYDGVGSVPIAGLADRIAAYKAQGLRVFSIYVTLGDPKLPAAIELLKNSGTTIELTVRLKMEPETIRAAQELADLAAKANLRIALYPHAGFTIATIDPALEMIRKVNRPNLGVMFNLCHYLKSEKPAELEATIERAGKHIFAASTCGADTDGKGWNQLIQPLDVGTFDQHRLFKTLKKIGFKGNVGIQCYAVKGDKRKNLERTMKAWREIVAAVNK